MCQSFFLLHVRLGSGVSSTVISVLLFLRQLPRIGARAADFCILIATEFLINCCTVGFSHLPP